MHTTADHGPRRLIHRDERVDVALCLCAAIALTAVVWALPRPIDDLFVALAGGRDIVAGRLGQPDDWAFTTHGRVWIDQNWGAHLATYLAYAAFGEIGLLVEKAGLLAAALAGIVFACRARGVGRAVALLAGGCAIAAGRSYIDLRPNLFSIVLTAVLLWTIARAPSRPSAPWIATLLVWIWSNVHGGFVLGLVLMALWTGSCAVTGARASGWPAARRCWPAAAATMAALVLAAVANPFGWTNVAQSFVVSAQPVWRNVDEWRPLFSSAATDFGSVWEFVAVGVLWCSAILHRLVRPHDDDAALRLFDVASGVLAAAMALQARRFVPLAVLVLAPPIGVELDRVVYGRYRRPLTAALALASLVPVLLLARPVVFRYRADNPLYPPETLFERMIVATPFFPTGPVDFVNANGVGGRVLNAWAWEGYLRWRETRLQMLAGSRAQQVYDPDTYVESLRLLDGDESVPSRLAALDVHLAVFPLTPAYGGLLDALVYADDAHWTYLYDDGRHVVLADATAPATAPLVARVRDGTLTYPDDGVAAVTRALYLATPVAHAAPDEIRGALIAAVARRPIGLAYAALGDLAASGRMSIGDAIAFLAGESRRLAAVPSSGDVLEARRWIATVLAGLDRQTGRASDAAARQRDVEALTAELGALRRRWGWGDTPGFSAD